MTGNDLISPSAAWGQQGAALSLGAGVVPMLPAGRGCEWMRVESNCGNTDMTKFSPKAEGLAKCSAKRLSNIGGPYDRLFR